MYLTEKFQEVLESNKYVGLEGSSKSTMARILENQEADYKLSESTYSSDIAQFTPILIPLVRRVYPALIANDITGVQALTMPTGYIYAMTNRYTGTSDNTISPNNKGQILAVNDASAFTVGGDVATAAGATGKVVYIEGNNLLVSNTSNTIFANSDVLDNANPFSAGAASVTATYSNQALFTKVLKNYTGPYATTVAEQMGSNMKEVGFEIERAVANAQSRKLKGKYTLETLQDMKSMHGLDAEKELMDMMAMELKLEIDRDVIAKVNSTATVVGDANISTYDGRWEVEKYRMLAIKLANEARIIGQETRKGGGNTILASGKVVTALEQLGGYIVSPVKNTIDSVMAGITPAVGTFDNRYKVVTDNFATSDYATVLYKGASNKDSGVFFAPYVGASFVKTTNPESGQPTIILSTRYDVVNNPMNPETYLRTFAVNFSSTVLG